jgi:hypothetical protein
MLFEITKLLKSSVIDQRRGVVDVKKRAPSLTDKKGRPGKSLKVEEGLL